MGLSVLNSDFGLEDEANAESHPTAVLEGVSHSERTLLVLWSGGVIQEVIELLSDAVREDVVERLRLIGDRQIQRSDARVNRIHAADHAQHVGFVKEVGHVE